MFTADRYRGKAIEPAKLARTASGPDASPDYKAFEGRCVELTGTAQGVTGISDRVRRVKDHAAGPSKAGGNSTMRRRTNGLDKPEIIVAGVFANKILSTIDKRFAVRVVGDGYIDFDTVDFGNVRLAIIFGYGHKIAETPSGQGRLHQRSWFAASIRPRSAPTHLGLDQRRAAWRDDP